MPAPIGTRDNHADDSGAHKAGNRPDYQKYGQIVLPIKRRNAFDAIDNTEQRKAEQWSKDNASGDAFP
jgi:hypothetical protein